MFVLFFSAGCLADCPTETMSRKELLSLKQNKFEVPANRDIQTLAIALTACLADKDPVIRDEVAYSALQSWMRGRKLSKATVHSLFEILSGPLLKIPYGKAGFREPFSALVLAEVARFDRHDPTLTTEERNALVTTAVFYMDNITDYRGYDVKEGYRHGVAHAADLMMQLSLNTALEKPQLDQILAAIRNKIRFTGEHRYIYGEPTRLMAPVFYIAKRKLHSEQEWKEWFSGIASPKPEASWNDSLMSQTGWAKKQNAESFLLTMYVNVNESSNKEMQALLLPAISAALHEMP